MSVKIIYYNSLFLESPDNIDGKRLDENELIKIKNRYIPCSKFLYEMACDKYDKSDIKNIQKFIIKFQDNLIKDIPQQYRIFDNVHSLELYSIYFNPNNNLYYYGDMLGYPDDFEMRGSEVLYWCNRNTNVDDHILVKIETNRRISKIKVTTKKDYVQYSPITISEEDLAYKFMVIQSERQKKYNKNKSIDSIK